MGAKPARRLLGRSNHIQAFTSEPKVSSAWSTIPYAAAGISGLTFASPLVRALMFVFYLDQGVPVPTRRLAVMQLSQTLTQRWAHVLRPMSISAHEDAEAFRRRVLKAQLLGVATVRFTCQPGL